MGIYRRSTGIYYVQLNINGKTIQKSLKTRSHALAKDLYHVILREHILKSWFEPREYISAVPNEKEIKTTKTKQTPSFERMYLKYLDNCKTQDISKNVLLNKNNVC